MPGLRSRQGIVRFLAAVQVALLVGSLFGFGTGVGAGVALAAPAGQGLQFNGTDERATFGTAVGLGAPAFTLELWFQRTGPGVVASTGTGGVSAIPLITKGRGEGETPANLNMAYFLGIDGTTGMLVADFEDAATGGNHPVSGTTVVTSNVWHHAAATYGSGTWNIYLDGVLDKTLAVGAFTPEATSIQHAGIGTAMTSTGATQGFFEGIVDEARIWNIVRSQAQISAARSTEIAATNGLIGLWHMNEPSGTTTADVSGSGITGTLVNTPLRVTGFNGAGFAIQLNGSTQRVTFGKTTGLGAPAFTLELWFRRTGPGVGTGTGAGGITSAIPLITKGRAEGETPANLNMNYFLGIDATTGFLVADFEDTATGGNHPVTGITAVTSNVWHHAAVTYAGSTWNLYLDGALERTLNLGSVFTPEATSIQHAAIATAMTSTGVAAGFFQGTVDEARIWNIVRTPAQIVAAKNLEIAPTNGLIGVWNMNEGTGTVINDGSGSTITGSLVNAPTWVPGFDPPSTPPSAPVLTAPANGATGVVTPPTLDVIASDPDSGTVNVQFFGRPLASGNFASIGTDSGVISGDHATMAWPGLGGGQTYEWFATVSDGTTTTTGPTWSFHTAAGTGTPFTGAGDIATCANDAGTNDDARTAAILAGIDGAIFTTGDNVYPNGTADEFTNCYDPVWGPPFKARTRPVPGNHDWNTANLAGYKGYFGANATDANGQSYYSYDLDTNWHVVNLDSECDKVPGGCGVGSAQEVWLKADLAAPANASKNVIAIWHKPRFSSGITNLTEVQPLVDALYAAGVDIALVGHDHIYERFQPLDPSGTHDPAFGIRHFTIGTGGEAHHGAGTALPTSQALDDNTFGIIKFTLRPTDYDWVFLPIAGSTFTDSGSGTVHDAPPGPGDNGLQLGPSGAYVTFGDPAKLDLAQFTIETWFNRTAEGVAQSTGTGGIPLFIPLVTHGGPQGEGSNIDANWLLGIDDATDVLAVDSEEAPGGPGPLGQNHPVRGTTPITMDAWHHAAATYDGTTWRIYLDGQLEATQATPAPRSDTIQHAGLGVMLNSSGLPATPGAARFHGILDETRVWNTARSLGQIQATINSQLSPAPAGLVARWPMSESVSAYVGDSVTSPPAAPGRIVGAGASRVPGAPFDIVFDTTPPAPPSGLVATPGDATVNLAWTANGESDLAGYRVYRATAPGVPTTGTPLNGATLLTSPAFADDTAVNGTPYYYVVVAVDTSGNPSTASNEATATPQPAPGANGLDLGAAGAYVTFGNPSKLDLGEFTIETWFKRTGPGVSGTSGAGGIDAFIPLVTNGGPENDLDSNIDANWLLGIDDATDVIAADFEEGAAGTDPGLNHPVRGVTPITLNVWHHAAATYDGTRWRLYLDGRLEATLLVDEPPRSDTIQHAALGASLQSNGLPFDAARFQGVLDEVRVWSAARTQAEIRAAINSEEPAGTGLAARWPMSEGGGDVVGDSVTAPVAVNGTITGTGATRVGGAPFNIVLDVVAPAVPTGLTATAGDGSVSLAWTAPSDTDLAGYHVFRATVPAVPTDGPPLSGPDPVTSAAYADDTATNGITYYYVVVAVDTSGHRSGASNEVSATPQPAAPAEHALDLGGGYVTFGQASGLNTPVFTLETWFRRDGVGTPASTSGGGGGISAIPLIAKGRGGGDTPADVNMNWFLGIDAATGVLAADFEDNAGGTNHPILSTTVIGNGTWHHAAATYDGTTWRLYLDGVLEATETEGATPEATSILHASLGTAFDSAGLDEGRFDGALDETRIWNVARSAAQIDSTKNVELSAGSGLVARWGMNETSPTTIDDSVGAIDGTIVGATARIDGAPMPVDPVLVGAGDIADCTSPGDEATELLLDGIAGTVFTAGDNAYESGTAAEFNNCYDPSWGQHKARTMPAPGNHDYLTAGAAGYFGYFGPAAGDPALGYYAYDRGTWRVFSLNSQVSGPAMAAQVAWLRGELEANSSKNVVAYWHIPLFSSGNVHGNQPNSQPLWDVLYEFGADIVIAGHEHVYERFAPQSPSGVADAAGIRQFTAGTGGRSHYGLGTPKANSEVFNGDTFGVLKLTLHDNSYSWQFVPAAGTFTDSGVSLTVDPVGDVAPAAPTGLAAAPGDDTVSLTWTANSEGDLAGYNVYRGLTTPDPATDTPLNGSTLVTSPSYTDPTAANGGTYHFVVTAVDLADHESAASAEAVATPFEPTPHALDFDGTDDHVTFGPAPGLGLTTFTIEGWVRRDGIGTGASTGSGGLTDAVPLITKGRAQDDAPANNMNWFLGIDEATGVLVADFEDDSGGNGHPIIGSSPIEVGRWYHVAATYDGTTWRLYVNGGLDASEVESATPEDASTQHAALATAMNTTGAPSGRFNGVLDEVRIWSVARSQALIQAAMGNELEPQAGLVARWAMNEGSGTAVINSVPGGPEGLTSGGPAWVAGTPFVSDANRPPAQPTSPSPADGATGVSTSPTLSVNVSDPDGDPLTTSFFGRPAPTTPGEDFTIVVIPDTQHYTDDAGRAPTFTQQTQWIVDNTDDLNIVMVSHLGDITENFDTLEVEWQRADASMDVLDTAGIPNNLAPGNHDMGAGETFNFYDSYFPPSRYNLPGNPWYGGWLGEETGQTQRQNKDNYELFSAGGIDFLLIHIEIDWPSYAVTWANEIIDRYPSRTVILSTHAFLNTSNNRPTGTITGRANGRSAAQVWTELISPNCNVRFVVNGHYPGEGRATTNNSCGQPVHQILTDYQSRSNGGDGWLRYYTFKPSENKVYAFTYSPKLGTFENDATSQFTLDHQMGGSGAFTHIGTTTTPSGGTASLSWPARTPGIAYEWYASISDGPLTTIGPTSTFTTAVNGPPTFNQDLPNRTDAEGAVISLSAAATDPDGDTLVYGATNLPPGLTINSSTGLISGTIAFSAAPGPYAVSVTVRDTPGLPDDATDTFSWTVTDATPPSGITFRSASYGSNNAITTSLTLARPAPIVAGDLLLAAVTIRGTSTITPPAGWTLVRNDVNATNLRQATYWRTATAAEPATYTWTFSGPRLAAGGIHAYSGVHATTPIDIHGGQANPSGTSLTAPGVTTTVAGTRLVAFYSMTTNATITPPPGMTERGEQIGTDPTRLTVIEGSDALQAAAGPTGPRVATASLAGLSIGQLIALRPAP